MQGLPGATHRIRSRWFLSAFPEASSSLWSCWAACTWRHWSLASASSWLDFQMFSSCPFLISRCHMALLGDRRCSLETGQSLWGSLPVWAAPWTAGDAGHPHDRSDPARQPLFNVCHLRKSRLQPIATLPARLELGQLTTGGPTWPERSILEGDWDCLLQAWGPASPQRSLVWPQSLAVALTLAGRQGTCLASVLGKSVLGNGDTHSALWAAGTESSQAVSSWEAQGEPGPCPELQQQPLLWSLVRVPWTVAAG